MSLRRLLTTGLFLRRGIRALDRIADGLAEQNRLLTRLADEFAPVPPTAVVSRTSAPADISYLDASEVVLVEEFTAQMQTAQHRDPTDDEVLAFLAESKSVGWTQTLNAHGRE